MTDFTTKMGRPRFSPQRIWDRVEKSGDCWIWMGGKTPLGYGRITINGRCCYAHRTAYELTHGPIPQGMCVCHTCDNPSCCNPAHLWIGTHIDNMKDRDAKGRGRFKYKGGKKRKPAREGYSGFSAGAKLTPADVRAARKMYKQDGCAIVAIARQFNISESAIREAVKGRTWKEVTE